MDMPALHFLCPLEEEFSRLYAFSGSCQARPCAHCVLFAFPSVVLNVQVCVLFPKPAELSLFLHTFTNCLQLGAHIGSWPGVHGGGGRMRHVECWRNPWASWDDLQVRQPQRLMGGLPDGVCKTVSRICISSICFIHSPGCCSPSHSLPPSCAVHDAVLWVEQERNGSDPHSWGNQVLTHMFSVSPVAEIMGQEGLSWHFVHPGGSDTGKVKLLLLPSSTNPISDFFCSIGMCIFSAELRKSTEALSFMDDSQKSIFSGEENGRKLLYSHFDDFTLFLFNKSFLMTKYNWLHRNPNNICSWPLHGQN